MNPEEHPKPGMTFGPNGAIVIDYKHEHDGGNGHLPHGRVLAVLPHNEFHPYAVWAALSRQPEGHWTATTGSYFETLQEALKYF